MKIIKAGFSKTFPLNQYYEKIWMEAELNDGDNERDCLYDLKRKVESFFFESKAAAEKEREKLPFEIAETPTNPKSQEQTIIDGINSCTELKVLESYALIAKNNDGEIKRAYDIKIREFIKIQD